MPPRPRIPESVSKALLIESGHRCAVCGVACPLERAHIIPWSKSKQHRLEDLICLCANCHERADKEKWGEAVLREYKDQPWVHRQNNTPQVLGPRARIEIVIEKEYAQFDEHEGDIVRHALASFLKVSPSAIRIMRKTDGSVRLEIELPEDAADALITAYQNEDPALAEHLALFNIKEILPSRYTGLSDAHVLRYPDLAIRQAAVYDSSSVSRVAIENTIVPALAEEYEARFRRLFDKYYGALNLYFSNQGFDSEVAKDLAQQTFVVLYRGLGAFREPENQSAWIFRIAQNVALNELRARKAFKKSRLPAGSESLEEIGSRHDQVRGSLDLDPLDEAISRERTQLLREAISQLPPRMKSALVMRIYSDMKYDEIAETMGISIQTVKSLLFQARRRLKERLSGFFDEAEL